MTSSLHDHPIRSILVITTEGIPGHHEIIETQELYPAILNAIVATGFKGFVGQVIVAKDPLASLRAAIKLCDV